MIKKLLYLIGFITFICLSYSHACFWPEATPSNKPQRAIIIGASSGIGKALAKELSQHNYTVGLTARRINLLTELQSKLPHKSYVKEMDLRQTDKAMQTLNDLINEMGGVDLIVINSGVAHRDDKLEWEKQQEVLAVNVNGFTAMANVALKHFKEKKQGHLVGISSILALRPGRNGYTYSSSKAFQSTFLEGVRNTVRHDKLDICVTDIQPGFVETDIIKDVPNKMWVATPEEAARQIYEAIQAKKQHTYVTKRWRLVAWGMKLIPDWLFDKVQSYFLND